MSDNIRTPYSRVFTIENTAGPGNVPVYQGVSRAMGPSWALGSRTPVREPDPDRYGAFRIVEAIKGERELPTLSIEGRYQYTASAFLALGRKGCEMDVHVHFGKCQDPRDHNLGWDKILVMERANINTWGAGELGALEQGEDAVINETIDLDALDLYEILNINLSEFGGTEVIAEVVSVVLCDSVTCGECGIPSDGCQVVFAITLSQAASPGLPAELIYSRDGWTTLGETNVATLDPDDAADALACVGTRLVVVSNSDDSIHYATIVDILNGVEVWVEMNTGIEAAGSPIAIFSAGAGFTWLVGDGGYVYFSSDITASFSTQTAGGATTEDLKDVHGIDELNLVAVGDNNAVIRTRNGGTTWDLVVGPAVGVNLTAIWMKTELEWFIGDAGGNLWYTRDGGVNWTQKAFAGDGAGVVRDIQFATPTVGYMAHDTATPAGRILRTVDGGYSWYVLPEGTGTIPDNDRITSIAACGEDVNVIYAGGLADDAVDGVLVKGA